ncbi:ubiquinone/menaquinone biosynthesis C-methylase UbiE [Peptoniphilus koenoeneniae]|uniref:Ubiquinone/menaquinone biosynthesis C-methylase UbiE n=1 Tax=Peptoniphilus koenoeneniae TaxID=507751 RepID=A0ABU0AVP1_9FIRM|nr:MULTISPECIES: class I SAM-dependent methyltransferase [Peptoniphilus]ERT57247.1 ribosomal protein L11 methyltransferase-like protein [Peptoniphilus sp. BV3C26]MDQ0274909.1 ubiquinone/menaquinone biosynthesis C-methylase UbiE [Peptoniphilus koenoeneniae]
MFKSFLENFKNPKDNFGGRFILKSMNKGHEKLAKWGRSYIKIEKEYTVLDLGCGGGANIEYFLTKAKKVYGLDHSEASIKMASEINKEAIKAGRCQISVGDVKSLPFKDESMDIVTAFETIYFWNDIEECFKEIYRVLKKGGQFLICNEASSKERRDVRKISNIIDMEVYTPDDLSKMLEKLGFKFEYYLDRKKQVVFIARK